MKITDGFLRDLEAKAKAATPGEWQIFHVRGENGPSRPVMTTPTSLTTGDQISLYAMNNLEFSEAAQPAHVLAMVAEIRALRGRLNINDIRDDATAVASAIVAAGYSPATANDIANIAIATMKMRATEAGE